MKQDFAINDQVNEFNFRNNNNKKLQKLDSIIESEEEEKALKSYKENRPVKNSVQFENKIIITNNGYDNKSYVNDNDQSAYDFKPRNKSEKKADSSNPTVKIIGYSDRMKNILFGIICINYLFYGFANNLIGSTLPQIREHLKVSNKEILSSFTVRYTSYFISNFITIYTFRHLRQYQYCLGVLFYSFVFFIIPSVSDYRQFMALFAILGAGNVLMDSIPILLTVEMFQEKSKFYSQVMFIFFAFGGFLGPLVGSQFVSPSPTAIEEMSLNSSMNSNSDFNPAAQYYVVYNIFDVFFHHNLTHHHHISSQNSTSEVLKGKSSLHIPFYLIGSLFATVLVIQTLIQFFYPYEKPKVVDLKRRSTLRVEPYFPVEELPLTTEEECETVEKEDTKLPSYYKKSVIICFCIVLLCFNSIDQTLSLFLSTYLNGRSELEIPLNVQSSFYSYLAITNTLGKLCSLVLIFYIPQKTYLFMNWTLILCGIVLMNFVTVNQIYILKISLLMIGAGISSTYPLVFTLANKRVLITSKTQTIFLFAIVSQVIYLPIVFGHFFEKGYPKIFNLFLNTFSSLALLAMITFHFIDLKRTSFLRNINSKV